MVWKSLVLLSVFIANNSCADPVVQNRSLLSILRGSGPSDSGGDTVYAIKNIDLDSDGDDDALVWVEGSIYCGTSGCEVRIFENRNGSYFDRGRIRSIKLPLRMLPTRSSGWNDLALLVSGGGVAAHYARFRFDGSQYPEYPSERDAMDADTSLGVVLLDGEVELTPLFPQ
jgi:hypothetical protein